MPENPLEPLSPEDEHRIRERAYYLWVADGRPGGREAEYWERARELQAIADSRGAGTMPNPMTEHPTPPPAEVIEEASIQENLGEFPDRFADQGEWASTPMPRDRADKIAAEGMSAPGLLDLSEVEEQEIAAATGPAASAPPGASAETAGADAASDARKQARSRPATRSPQTKALPKSADAKAPQGSPKPGSRKPPRGRG